MFNDNMFNRRDFLKQGVIFTGLLAGDKLFGGQAIASGRTGREFALRIDAEEELYRYVAANNGAGPMWAKGLTGVVRSGNDVFASGLETVPDVEGLSNCRWMLFKRYPSGWKLETKDPVNLTREPCPMAVLDDQTVLLSVNPKQADSCVEYCLTQPEILQFNRDNPQLPYRRFIPVWKKNPGFNDHSYRAFAVDRKHGEMILFQNHMYHHAEWSFMDRKGNWSSSDSLNWPVETYAGKEVPLRLCYSNAAVRDKQVFFFAAADVVEPVKEWLDYKKELTGANWDYVFRRLFFSWSDDISRDRFHPWVEIANRDKTAGHIRNQDMWIDRNGGVHLLWIEKAIDERLRDRFFPDERQHWALNYAVIEQGRIKRKTSLVEYHEGDSEVIIPGSARFHALPDGRLFVVDYVHGQRANGDKVSENRILEVLPDGTAGAAKTIPFRKPFRSFQTANERAGCAPSPWLDLLGEQEGNENTISYACVFIG